MGLSVIEQRNKIRAKNKSLGITYKDYEMPKKKRRSLNYNKKKANSLMNDQRLKRNPNELKFRNLLIEHNIKYIWQKPFYNTDRYVCVDFYFPEVNVVVEIDGKIHEENKQYDLDRTMYLKRTHNIKDVLRLTNKQVALKVYEIVDTLFDKLQK